MTPKGQEEQLWFHADLNQNPSSEFDIGAAAFANICMESACASKTPPLKGCVFAGSERKQAASMLNHALPTSLMPCSDRSSS